jgi:hypothetical protein
MTLFPVEMVGHAPKQLTNNQLTDIRGCRTHGEGLPIDEFPAFTIRPRAAVSIGKALLEVEYRRPMVLSLRQSRYLQSSQVLA